MKALGWNERVVYCFSNRSKKQRWITLREKRDRDKRYIKTWRLIFLLNVDTKIVSKTFSERLKNVLFSLIPTQQTAYIKNRLTEEVVG